MVASAPSQKGKGCAEPSSASGEGQQLSLDVLSKDKFPMTNEYLAMCQEVWNCPRQHAEDTFPLSHMELWWGFFTQNNKTKKGRQGRTRRERRWKKIMISKEEKTLTITLTGRPKIKVTESCGKLNLRGEMMLWTYLDLQGKLLCPEVYKGQTLAVWGLGA
jgi:hypothetical protein